MKTEDFDRLLEERIQLTREVLASKNKEYASGDDKLHNFKRAADMLRCTPEKALVGMWTKHIISILDIVDKLEDDVQIHGLKENIDIINEKIGDAINYLILLEALLKERLKYD